jgi:hypothetical protein
LVLGQTPSNEGTETVVAFFAANRRFESALSSPGRREF